MATGGDDSGLVRVQLLGLPVQARLRFSQHLQDLTRELSLVQIGAERRPGTDLPPRLLGIAAELNGPYAAFRSAPDAVVQEALAAGRDHCDVTYVVPPSAGPFLQRHGEVLEEANDFCRGRSDLLLLPATEEVVAYRHWIVAESSRQLAGQAPRPWRAHPAPPADLAPAQTRQDATPALSAPAPTVVAGRLASPPSARSRSPRPPLVMDSVASSVAAARRHVREVLRELEAPDLEESAELGVSELVTNAVLHARSAFTLGVHQLAGGRLRIEVSDTSPLPVQPRHLELTATTGRGLRLVAEVSWAWGVDDLATGGPGKTVWFEPRGLDTVEPPAAQDWVVDLDALI